MLAFTTSLRNNLGYIYFAGLIILAQAMRRSHGSLKTNHLIFISLLTLFILFERFKKSQIKDNAKFLCVVVFLIMGIAKFEIIYPASETWAWVYRGGLTLILGLVCATRYLGERPVLKNLVYGILVALFFCVPLASPSPAVDVWVYYEKAISALATFTNPYELTYPDIYQGAHHYNPKLIYWPFSLYLIAPFGLFFDVRYALVFSMLFSAYLLKKKLGLTFWDVLIFLLFPINFFVIEQSWIEPLMVPFLILHFKYAREERFLGSALALGVLCGLKQFMLAPFLLSSLYFLMKKNFKLTLIAPTVIIASFLPFLILSPATFIQNTFFEFLHFPARSDSMSWVAHFLFHYQYEINGLVTALIYGITLFYCAFILWRERTINVLLWGHFLTLSMTFLFGKQSFANYYFLLFIVYFLALVVSGKHDIWATDEVN